MRYLVPFLLAVFTASAQMDVAQPAAKTAAASFSTNKFGRKNLTGVTAQPAATVIVNAASYLPGISPGGLSTIFGKNLSHVSDVVVANTNPLPTILANVSIRVNGRPAPIFSVAYNGSDDQISFQVPYRTETGPNAAEVQVYDSGNLVADIITDSFTEDPGIFVYQGKYAIAVRASNNTLIGPNNPASPGEVIVLYTTGLGRLTLDLQDGYGAPSSPLAYTSDPFQVVVNGQQCQILFSGLGPGFVGLYQINLVLPRNLPAGDLNMQILSQYGDSAVVKLPVF